MKIGKISTNRLDLIRKNHHTAVEFPIKCTCLFLIEILVNFLLNDHKHKQKRKISFNKLEIAVFMIFYRSICEN